MGYWIRRGLMALAVAAGALVGEVQAQTGDLRVETRQGRRTAIVAPAERGPAPTVIVLHGAFSSAAWTMRHYGFAEAAAARGFAAVFPQGLRGCWNDGRNPFPWRADDVAFLKVLAGELIAEGIAEPSRIYLAGISNGGMMAMRMLCEASDLFAGAGTIIANMPMAIGAKCHPARPMPIVMFNGSADSWVPYRGGGVGFLNLGGFVWGTQQTADFIAHANRCNAMPATSDVSIDDMSVTRIAWTGCDRRANVTLYRVNGGRPRGLWQHEYFVGQARR
ncbi:MAG: prolyl oligopeptidase family serine peptidase [Rhodospirillales bacterium]|nr:prolyl oligopeptidase family serine peptidase [Rhodospirillales bacterium]